MDIGRSIWVCDVESLEVDGQRDDMQFFGDFACCAQFPIRSSFRAVQLTIYFSDDTVDIMSGGKQNP